MEGNRRRRSRGFRFCCERHDRKFSAIGLLFRSNACSYSAGQVDAHDPLSARQSNAQFISLFHSVGRKQNRPCSCLCLTGFPEMRTSLIMTVLWPPLGFFSRYPSADLWPLYAVRDLWLLGDSFWDCTVRSLRNNRASCCCTATQKRSL